MRLIHPLVLAAMLTMIGCTAAQLPADTTSQTHGTSVSPSAPSPTKRYTPSFAAPPRLATTVAELDAVRAAPDFAKTRDAAVARADRYLAKLPMMPDGWSNWTFYYACGDDGTRLNALSFDRHECPKCKKVYTDERTVTAYRYVLNYECENASLALAWAYAYTGDDKYALPVRRYLLKLADMYPTLTVYRDRWGRSGILAPLGGRRYAQILDEAYGAVHYAKAYDMTRNSPVWSDELRERVEDRFFRQTIETLLKHNMDVSNHQTWYNAGLISIASVLADAKLVQRVLTMRGGVLDQLQRSVLDDGLWYEGTMAYHNYALSPMIEIADAARRMGIDLYTHPRLKLFILGPINAMYPDGSFPVTNDSDPANLRMFTWAYEWAWKTYREPVFAQAAAMGDTKKLAEMLGTDAKVEWPPAPTSRVLEASGFAMLRQGEGPAASCAVIDFGPHGGGHGHFDKLELLLFANGREWFLDPGRIDYSHKEYQTWVKHTAAHNTVVLGGASQMPHTGKMLFFQPEVSKCGAVTDRGVAFGAESTGGYTGSTLRRRIYVNSRFVVDVFDVTAAAHTQIDWLMHASAERVESPAGATLKDIASLGDRDGYPHLTSVKQWFLAPGAQAWAYAQGKALLPAWLVVGANETVFTCNGIGYNVSQLTPTIVRRVSGSKARFISVYDLGGDRGAVTGVTTRDRNATTPEVEVTWRGADQSQQVWRVIFGEKDVTADVRK